MAVLALKVLDKSGKTRCVSSGENQAGEADQGRRSVTLPGVEPDGSVRAGCAAA